jgi:hypothetical protein
MGIAILVLVSRHDRHVTGQGQNKACHIMFYIVATVVRQCLAGHSHSALSSGFLPCSCQLDAEGFRTSMSCY